MSTHPTHIGFIADGNRRWARSHGLPDFEGHRRGYDKIQLIVDELKNTDVSFVSFFVFSTENWSRSEEEVAGLMKLLRSTIKKFSKKADEDNLRIIFMGRPERVEPDLWQKILDLETKTAKNTGLTVCFCFNYGGHWEIVDAARKAAIAGEQDWTPESFRQYLYHPEVPDCDLIVRTSGEERISGFQLWRASYAEFLFLEKHFPDIEAADVAAVLDEYGKRQRRFGK